MYQCHYMYRQIKPTTDVRDSVTATHSPHISVKQ